MRILHLTLHRKWFDAIATGRKCAEYRDRSPYWVKRLTNPDGAPRRFDEIHFRNGYNPAAPFMRVEHLGTTEGHLDCKESGRPVFVLALGVRREISNWKGPKA